MQIHVFFLAILLVISYLIDNIIIMFLTSVDFLRANLVHQFQTNLLGL